MAAAEWTFAELEPDQLALLDLAERTLDTDVVLAYRPSRFGTVDPETIADGLQPVDLEPSQLECLQGLERMVDGVLVAYRKDVD
jgi:hypothetical protein